MNKSLIVSYRKVFSLSCSCLCFCSSYSIICKYYYWYFYSDGPRLLCIPSYRSVSLSCPIGSCSCSWSCSSSSSSFHHIKRSISLSCRTGSFPISLSLFMCRSSFDDVRVLLHSTVSIDPSLYRVVPDNFVSLYRVVPYPFSSLYVLFFVVIVLLPMILLFPLRIVESILN